MNDQLADEQVASIFNSSITAFAISAAWELGILDAIASEDSLNVEEFCAYRDLHVGSTASLVDVLVNSNVLSIDTRTKLIQPGILFDEVFRTKGFFHWLTRGSVQVFSDWPDISHNAQRVERFINRDGKAIAVACRDMGYQFFDKPFFDVLQSVSFESVADLGCGSAERLIKMASTRPHVRGVGVDISLEALGVAAEAVAGGGLQKQITLVRADARHLSHRGEFDGVDLVTCFLMGHDFWPRESFIESFLQLREAFPDVKNLILCDTYRSDRNPYAKVPVFTFGFEVGHAIMGQYLPTFDEWMDAFAESGWKCVDHREIPVPAYTSFFVLQPLE